jgi:hypothetical protein
VIVNADQDADDGSPFPYMCALDRVVVTLTDTPGPIRPRRRSSTSPSSYPVASNQSLVDLVM